MKRAFWFVVVILGVLPLSFADEALDALRAQVALERQKEADLQALGLEVDRLRLELEKKKTLVEMGRLSAESGGGNAVGSPNALPVIALRYVFIGDGRKEAVFDVDGKERRVLEGEVIGQKTLKSIKADGVLLQEKDAEDVFMAPGK
jgi:hypothetical protein